MVLLVDFCFHLPHKGNKELEKTEKLFDKIFNKIKLSKLAAGAFGAIKEGIGITSLSLGGMMAGLLGMAIYGASGSVVQYEQAKRMGITPAQLNALMYAGKQKGMSGALEGAMGNLVVSLRDITKSGAFATLGLSQAQLRSKNPVTALFEVLDAIKKSPFNNPKDENLLRSMVGEIGISNEELIKTVLAEGAGGFRGFYTKNVAKWSSLDYDKMAKGDRALIDFQDSLDKLTKKIGTAFAPTLEKVVGLLDRILPPLADMLAGFIDKIDPESVKGFADNMATIFEAVAKVAQGIKGAGGGMQPQDLIPFNFLLNPKRYSGKEHGMIVKELHIHVANVPKSPREVEQLVSGIRAQAMGGLA